MPAAQAVPVLRRGLAPRSVDDVAKSYGMTTEQFAAKAGIAIRTLRHRRAKGQMLSTEHSEKVLRAARIQRLAKRIFTTDVAVAAWMQTPAPALDGALPIDLLDTEIGARLVEDVLGGIAYGNVL